LSPGQPNAGTKGIQDTTANIAKLRRLSDQRKTLAELDQRIQDCHQLAGVYGAWSEDAMRSEASKGAKVEAA